MSVPYPALSIPNSEVRTLASAIVNDQPLSPSFYDGLQAQVVIAAAIAADQQECWVSL